MKLSELVNKDCSKAAVLFSSKKRILEYISELAHSQIPDTSQHTILDALMAREKLGSTGLGNGIAIPHCRVKNCHRIIGALMTLEHEIDYDAIDGKPVDIIFALMVPEEANDTHLKALASLAERLSQTQYLGSVREASDVQTLYEAAISLDE